MSDEILLTIGEDGKASLYDDTYDITIHCESQEEQDEVKRVLQNVPRWIPVTEQPPEVGESVLICDAYGDICLGHRTSSGYYFPDFCEDKVKDVRAWCNLLEPYKGVTT